MRIVIDAQLIAGYFREIVVGEAPFYSSSATELMVRLGSDDVAYADADGVLEGEYRALVDPDWFEAWYGERLSVGDINIAPSARRPDLVKLLVVDYGFPRKGNDRHYVELCSCLVAAADECVALISEDLDFYDPKAKARDSSYRRKLIENQGGPVARYLRKRERISVRCIKGHLDS